MRIDVLDDWAGVARSCADWAELTARAEVVIHSAPLRGTALAETLGETRILLPMRERTWLDAAALAAMPKLEMIALTGRGTRHVDVEAVRRRGITLCWSGEYHPGETAEFALGLMLAAERGIVRGAARIAAGGFMEGTGLGRSMAGLRLGILGLGNIGVRLARMAAALDMEVVAWSRSLTPERAAVVGAQAVRLDELLATSDVVSVNLVLSEQTRGLIGATELGRMKTGALLLNTARGPIVDEPALIAALREGRIRAALDVFDDEPLPPDHPFRGLPSVTLTPHLGYATRACMECFYRQSVENILGWMDGRPCRVLEI